MSSGSPSSVLPGGEAGLQARKEGISLGPATATGKEKNVQAPPSSSDTPRPVQSGVALGDGDSAAATTGREMGHAGAAAAVGEVEPSGFAPEGTGEKTHAVPVRQDSTEWVDLGLPGGFEVRYQPQFFTETFMVWISGVLHLARAACEAMLPFEFVNDYMLVHLTSLN